MGVNGVRFLGALSSDGCVWDLWSVQFVIGLPYRWRVWNGMKSMGPLALTRTIAPQMDPCPYKNRPSKGLCRYGDGPLDPNSTHLCTYHLQLKREQMRPKHPKTRHTSRYKRELQGTTTPLERKLFWEMGLRRVEAAELSGVSPWTLTQIFAGRIQDPKLSVALKLASFCKCPVDELFPQQKA